MMIQLRKLAVKSEGTPCWPTLDNEITTHLLRFSIISSLNENLTLCAKISSGGPLFYTGIMGEYQSI